MTLRESVTQIESVRNTSPDVKLKEKKKSKFVFGYTPITNHCWEQWKVVTTGMAIM